MFQKKIDELFSGTPNVFGTADDISIAGFNEQSKDHNEKLNKVLLICRQANLKLNKKVSFQMYQHSILWQSSLMVRFKPSSKESLSTYRDATAKTQKTAAVISGYIKLSR